MAQADLAGARLPSAANQARVGDRVVWRPEGALPDQRDSFPQGARHAVDLRHRKRLQVGHRRQDARHGACQQRLTRSRRTRHQEVVPPGSRHLQGTLHMLLAPNVAEIGQAPGRLDRGGWSGIPVKRGQPTLRSRTKEFAQRLDPNHLQAVDQSGFGRIDGGDDEAACAHLDRCRRNGEDAVNMAQRRVQGELAQKDRLLGD